MPSEKRVWSQDSSHRRQRPFLSVEGSRGSQEQNGVAGRRLGFPQESDSPSPSGPGDLGARRKSQRPFTTGALRTALSVAQGDTVSRALVTSLGAGTQLFQASTSPLIFASAALPFDLSLPREDGEGNPD